MRRPRCPGKPSAAASSTPAVLAVLAVLGLVVSGCGSSGDPGSGGSDGSPGSSPSASGSTSSDTIDLGDVDGYSGLTVRVDSVEKKAPCLMTNLPARNGDYVEVHLSFEAEKVTSKARSPLLVGNWFVQDASGHSQPADFSRTMLCLPKDRQLPTTLDKKGRASGGLVFDIPEDATRLVDKIDFVHPARKIVLGLTGSKPETTAS